MSNSTRTKVYASGELAQFKNEVFDLAKPFDPPNSIWAALTFEEFIGAHVVFRFVDESIRGIEASIFIKDAQIKVGLSKEAGDFPYVSAVLPRPDVKYAQILWKSRTRAALDVESWRGERLPALSADDMSDAPEKTEDVEKLLAIYAALIKL